ncbi:SpoIIE family protein phosphatase, partial [candidate division KSB1 bacterium]|nr:SpoIIE family protein phosphatase [candidate division KSB1 bacterium]
IYSDGISEAMNAASEEFGDQRLIEYVDTIKHLPAQDVIDNILGEVKNFVDGNAQSDDMTLVVIKSVH